MVGNDEKDDGDGLSILMRPCLRLRTAAWKRRICRCYLYLWIHAIWPSVKWWVIPAQQGEPLLNLQSPARRPCPLFPSPSLNPSSTSSSSSSSPSSSALLIAHAWVICWIWMQAVGKGSAGKHQEKRGAGRKRFLTEPASVTSFSPKEMWQRN